MKNYCLLAVVVAMLLHACQKENSVIPIQETESKSPIVVTHVSGEEIPEIMQLLGSKQSITTKSSLVSTPLGEVEIENILHTLDTLGNKNYSFLVLPETDNPNSIFNLVVSFSEEDTSPDMAILEYRMTEEFSHAYYSGEKDFAEFTGNLYKYPFTPETYADLLSKDTCVQNFDEIVICDEAIFTNGGAGGGSGTGSGLDYNPIGDGDDGGGSSSGSGAVVTAGWLCNHFGAMHENPAQCTNPGAGGTWIITFITVPDDHTDKGIVSAGKELTCCDDAYVEGNVATNLTTEALSDIMDCMGILSDEQFNTLKRWPRKTIALKNFLLAEQCSAEAKDFGKFMMDALVAEFDDLSIDELLELSEFEQDYRGRMSTSELAIFDTMSRFNQLGYLFNAQKATWRAEELYPNSLYNGKGDAFRHAYWNGLNVILLGYNLTESLTTAHEDKPLTYTYADKEKHMDLFNNDIGRNSSDFLSDGFSSLEESILDALNNGNLRYLNNLASDGRATSSSSLIPTNL